MAGEEVASDVTIRYKTDTSQARKEILEFGKANRAAASEVKASMAEARGATKLLSEEIGVNLNRHLTSFIAKLPGVAPLMAAAFPVAAVAGIGIAIFEAGTKLTEFIAKSRDAAGNIGRNMAAMQRDVQMTNDELALSNAKLAQQIAHLEHRPENMLAVALAEARVEAEKLTKALDTSYERMDKLIKDNSLNQLHGLVTNRASTSDDEKRIQGHLEKLKEIETAQMEAAHGAKNAAEIAKVNQEAEIKRQQAIKDAVQDITAAYNFAKTNPTYGLVGGISQDPTARLTMLGSAGHLFENMADTSAGMNQQSSQQQRLSKDQAAAANKAQLDSYLAKLHQLMDEGYRLEDEQKRLLEESDKIGRAILGDRPEMEKNNVTELALARIDAAKEIVAANKEAADAQQEWNIKQAESLGLITRQEAALRLQAIALDKLREKLEAQQADLAAAQAHPELWSASFNPERIGAGIQQTQGQVGVAQSQLQLAQYQNTLAGSMATMFNDWIQKATDLRVAMTQLFDEALNSVNATIEKLVTGQYHKGDWTKAGQQVFSSVSGKALQYGEGTVMKALGLSGLGGGKMGTQGNPMWVQLAGGGIGAAGGGLLSLFGGSTSSSASSAGSGVGSAIGSVISGLIPGLADGGAFSPGVYKVGEHGEEIMQLGGSGYMHNASSSRGMLRTGGGDMHIHVDARGSHDPAAVHMAVQRGIREAAPHIAAAAISGQHDMKRRRPSSAM